MSTTECESIRDGLDEYLSMVPVKDMGAACILELRKGAVLCFPSAAAPQSVLQRASLCLQLFFQALQDRRQVAKMKPFLCSQELGGVIFQQVMSSKSQWNCLR